MRTKLRGASLGDNEPSTGDAPSSFTLCVQRLRRRRRRGRRHWRWRSRCPPEQQTVGFALLWSMPKTDERMGVTTWKRMKK